MTLAEIESRLLAACLELRPQHPEAFEGYYDRLLSEGRILTDADRVIVEYVCERFPQGSATTELCAGIGQLSHALGLLGYLPRLIESDPARFSCCLQLGLAVASEFVVYCQQWQQMDITADVIICTNAVSQSNSPQDTELFNLHLDNGWNLIWQPSLFGVDGVPTLEGYNSVDLGHGVYHQWK